MAARCAEGSRPGPGTAACRAFDRAACMGESNMKGQDACKAQGFEMPTEGAFIERLGRA